MKLLESYDWPGNIRELKNTIIKGVLLSDKIIMPENLGISGAKQKKIADKNVNSFSPTEDFNANKTFNLKKAVRFKAIEVERDMIRKALEMTGGNKIKAAKLLGIDRKSLYNKIKRCQAIS